MGHSFQAIGILVGALNSVFAVPLVSRIHEGLIFSNRDHRTLLDKMVSLIESLGIGEPFFFIADAYYATGKIVRKLLHKGNHLITLVRSNAVAYCPALRDSQNRGADDRGYMEKRQSLKTSLMILMPCTQLQVRCTGRKGR
jgi:hypothetical protein